MWVNYGILRVLCSGKDISDPPKAILVQPLVGIVFVLCLANALSLQIKIQMFGNSFSSVL